MFLFPQNVVSISQRLSKAKNNSLTRGCLEKLCWSRYPRWIVCNLGTQNRGSVLTSDTSILPAGNMEEVWTVFSYFYIFGSLGLHQLPDEELPPKKHRKSCKDTEKNTAKKGINHTSHLLKESCSKLIGWIQSISPSSKSMYPIQIWSYEGSTFVVCVAVRVSFQAFHVSYMRNCLKIAIKIIQNCFCWLPLVQKTIR